MIVLIEYTQKNRLNTDQDDLVLNKLNHQDDVVSNTSKQRSVFKRLKPVRSC